MILKHKRFLDVVFLADTVSVEDGTYKAFGAWWNSGFSAPYFIDHDSIKIKEGDVSNWLTFAPEEISSAALRDKKNWRGL